MAISLESLETYYNADFDDPISMGWIAMPNSKEDIIIAQAVGSSGGNPNNGWKIHISIDPSKIDLAAKLILQELRKSNAPQVSIKFAGKQLAFTGQPSKQIALIFYEKEFKNKFKIAKFLNRIEALFIHNNIAIDERPINSDDQALKTKYDAMILTKDGGATHFNYRNEQCIVMEDSVYDDMGGTENTMIVGQQIWVKQSYYMQLPNSQKHNPGNQVSDPFASIKIESLAREVSSPIVATKKPSVYKFFSIEQQENLLPKNNTQHFIDPTDSCFTESHVADIEKLIRKLENEIKSIWPYPNKDRKSIKVQGLKALLQKSTYMSAKSAVEDIEREFPNIRDGKISTRTAQLLDAIRNDAKSESQLSRL